MMLEFLKKVFSKENTNDSSSPVDKEKDLKSVGVNNENDREYREKRMLQLETLDLSEEQLEKSKHIFDTWLISRWVDDDENVSFRSEEHTSELQSRFDLVCRLLLEKKKNRK